MESQSRRKEKKNSRAKKTYLILRSEKVISDCLRGHKGITQKNIGSKIPVEEDKGQHPQTGKKGWCIGEREKNQAKRETQKKKKLSYCY